MRRPRLVQQIRQQKTNTVVVVRLYKRLFKYMLLQTESVGRKMRNSPAVIGGVERQDRLIPCIPVDLAQALEEPRREVVKLVGRMCRAVHICCSAQQQELLARLQERRRVASQRPSIRSRVVQGQPRKVPILKRDAGDLGRVAARDRRAVMPQNGEVRCWRGCSNISGRAEM